MVGFVGWALEESEATLHVFCGLGLGEHICCSCAWSRCVLESSSTLNLVEFLYSADVE